MCVKSSVNKTTFSPVDISMPKVKVVDISDPNRFQEILDDVEEPRDKNERPNVESDSDEESDDVELGLVPRLFFTTFSTLTILVPLVSTHIALDIIVHQQYAQDFDSVEIVARAGTVVIGMPLIFCLHYSPTVPDRCHSSA